MAVQEHMKGDRCEEVDEVPGGPLAGIRIIDLSAYEAGPMVGLIAGDLGADVIKVESIQRLDGWRGSGRSDDRPWECSPQFNWVNRNKRGITLNLTHQSGTDVFRRLVAVSDVVIENFTPRVMKNFGLDYEALKSGNSSLVMLSMPGFGGSGPWKDYTAFAWTTEEMSTLTHLTGYADSGPLLSGICGGDPLAALMGALALMAALHHRRRTGVGQYIDLSQVEAATSFMGEVILAAELEKADPCRMGNRSTAMCPHGVYACSGEDRWVAIACRDDREWALLWSLMHPEGDQIRFGQFADRLAQVQVVDAMVSAWTASQAAEVVMGRLQEVLIPAGVVMDGGDILQDPHLAARGFHLPLDRDVTGVWRYPGEPFRFMRRPLPGPRRAPYLGESNRDVMLGLLGMSETEFTELERERVIGTRPA